MKIKKSELLDWEISYLLKFPGYVTEKFKTQKNTD